MSKINFAFLFFFFLIHFSFAQNNPSDNKNIGLCTMYGDTLKLDDLKTCTTITIRSDKKVTVTSFTFAYYITGNMDVKVINGFSDSISKADLEQFFKIKPEKIFLQDVIGEGNSENLNLGHRTIYLK